jgi:glycosyltransferase involved in cell wall biosynthesis
MKVAVINTSSPFARGGAEHLADSLVKELATRGHLVQHVKVPLRWATTDDVAESMFAAAALRIPEAERVIALKFPAYLVPHPNKVIWLLHQFRQVYDLWGTELQDLPDSPSVTRLQRAVRSADNLAFSESRAVYCNSPTTARRLLRFNRFAATVLLPPHAEPDRFRRGNFGDYVLSLGRITGAKRQCLLVEAMAATRSAMRLVVAGAPETPDDLKALENIVVRHDLEGKVELIPRFISDDEKVALLADARAVAYVPVDEDSYGYVTAEAMMSGKPVLTAADSGGILELVEHDVTGVVADPTPGEMARAIDMMSDWSLAARLGAAAFERLAGLDLSWDHTIEQLLS